MAFSVRRGARHEVPAEVLAAVELLPRERILAAARDEGGTWILVGTMRLYAVGPASELLARPWLLVDTGGWDHDSYTLTVTWVDGARPQSWRFRESTALLAAFRERVQASVVLSEAVPLPAGRTARVVIRKDLSDGGLSDQTVLGRGARMSDPQTAERVGEVRDRLREQVGLQ